MIDHKPECPMLDEQWPKHPLEVCPYCDMITACEERVEETWSAIAGRDQYAEGYAAALDAAREAVAALEPMLDVNKHNGGYDCCGCSTPAMLLDDAAIAIDSLRERT